MHGHCSALGATQRHATVIQAMELRLDPRNLPMFWNVAQPVDAGRLESGVRIDAAGDSTLDDYLLLLLQQFDQLQLGADIALDSTVGITKEPHNQGLLV